MVSLSTAFVTVQDAVSNIFGASPELHVLLENTTYPFAHEAGIFIPAEQCDDSQHDDTLWITSNQFPDPESGDIIVKVSRVTLPSDRQATPQIEEIDVTAVQLANGGTNYKNGLLLCAQGTLTIPGGIGFVDYQPPFKSYLLISDFYGREFNSINDVVAHSDGSIWFTDPIYGFEQGIRPKPRLPNQVYRFDPETQAIRAVADGFGRPNGLAFSPDEKIVYVTDTEWTHGDGNKDDTRASTM